MIDHRAEGIRPYLKSTYNAACQLPGMKDAPQDMTPYTGVAQTDVKLLHKTEKGR